MPMVRGMRMLNAIEAGTLNATDLQTLLTADAGRLAELNTLFSLRGQMRRAMQSVTPRTAIFGSPAALDAMVNNFDAMQTVVASQTAMTAIAASSVAMTAVAASSVAMTAIANSQLARLALFNGDAALDAIFNNSSARDILRASSSYGIVSTSSTTTTSSRAIPVPDTAGSYIVLGFSASGTGVDTITVSTLRAGTTRPAVLTIGSTPSSTATGNAATPLVSPFAAVGSGSTNTRSFNFGLLRCDA